MKDLLAIALIYLLTIQLIINSLELYVYVSVRMIAIDIAIARDLYLNPINYDIKIKSDIIKEVFTR